MKLSEKIKLLFSREVKQKDKISKEIISLGELPSKIEKEFTELNLSKEQIKSEILNKIISFESDINQITHMLENIDISHRKEYDKIKIIVNENLNLYIKYLKRTIDNLKKVEDSELEDYISRIIYILNEFNRISAAPFEKATILIGKELVEARSKVRLFIQEFNEIIEENRNILEKNKLIKDLSALLSESKQLTQLKDKIEETIVKIQNGLQKTKNKYDEINDKISEVQASEDFNKDEQEKVNLKDRLDSIDKELWFIRKKIDLKSLRKEFHQNKIIDQLIQHYILDFKEALKDDKELKILNIIKEENKVDAIHLHNLQGELIDLSLPLITKTDREIINLEEELNNIKSYIFSLESNIGDEMKRKEKIHTKIQKLSFDIEEGYKSLIT